MSEVPVLYRSLMCLFPFTKPTETGMDARGGQEPAAQASVGQVCSLERERAQLEAMNRELTQMLLKMNTLCCKFTNTKHFLLTLTLFVLQLKACCLTLTLSHSLTQLWCKSWLDWWRSARDA